MEIIINILNIIFLLVFIYLGIYCFYLFLFSLSGKLIHIPPPPETEQFKKFVIYIPAYKEDAIILNTAASAIQLDYPEHLYHVCIIADSLKPETVTQLKAMRLQVVEVVFESSTKSKALHKAIENTTEGFDAAVVYDIDNVAAPDFLQHLNRYLVAGHKVVQGHRVAKNTDTPIAVLDAISEEINNHIFRKAQRVFNLSAAIIGSGMALEYNLFKSVMLRIDAVGGFDKEMGLLLTRDRISVAYSPGAIIYDEKVSQAGNFKNQRKRWLSAQFSLFGKYWKSGITEFFKQGNRDYLNEVYHTAILPRVLMLGIMPIMLVWSLTGIGPSWHWWLAATVLCYAAIIIAIPSSFFNKKLINAVLKLPFIFLTMLMLLFKLKGANKKFIHTAHHTGDSGSIK
jgi:cellulose synthase/poly-beta-1,6-N-acetylglucosamine synthase-like glycosyltransferase